ncbi:hypothetical protein C1645_800695 [Glomus cerebriforme]|uniref:C2H2-type domain-containing protein n=1 Tax=Glomus cerebriforme TaxID=658196 RepID=A0A397TM96_9GLOM|nr:hypothetical protein C1645_800695 [Glomus cerebriforme]
METQKNVVTEDSAESSNTSNDKITVPNNLFNNLIDNLEEFEGRHAQSSHDYSLTCPECSQVFSQKALRKQHIKKKYACQFCNKRVKGEGGLISHCKAKHSHLSVEEIYSELIGIQFPTLREQISAQKEDELNELKLAYEKGSEEDNDSYGDDFTEEENEESNDDYNTEEENEGSGDTEDGDEASDDNDYTEEENEGSDDDST